MITRREWHWVAVWAALTLLLANAPLLLGWALSTNEMSFGGAVYAVEDVHSYLADMRQGWRGEWLFHNPYTPEDHPGALIYLHYLLLGKLAARSGLSLEAAYQLARAASGALLLVIVYHFIAQFTPHRAVRRAAFLLAAFSGGMGWALIVIGQDRWLGSLPVDLISPEGYVFLTLNSAPHIALATAGALWGTVRVYRASSVKRQAQNVGRQEGFLRTEAGVALVGGLAFAGVAVIGPFYLVAPFAVLCTGWLVTTFRQRRADWRALALIGLAGVPPAPLAVYTLVTFAGHPVYRAWYAQNQVASPHPLHYLAGYALPGALALACLAQAARQGYLRRRLALPIVWVALVPLLLYLPLNVQRRLILGAQVPLSLLAAEGLVVAVALPFGRSRLARRLTTAAPGSRRVRDVPPLPPHHSRRPRYTRRGLRRLLVAAVLLAATLTNLLLVAGTALQVARRAPPIYHPRAELAALDWLAAHTSLQDTVLCAYETGNYLPARAGNRVVLGLGPQTVDLERKRDEVRMFFDGAQEGAEADAWRQDLLRRYGVAYVLAGPHERMLAAAVGHRPYDLDATPYLDPVYNEGGYALYRVNRSELSGFGKPDRSAQVIDL